MVYRGACHCGAVRAEYETQAPVRLRQDGCGFCSSRGVKSASDANGALRIWSDKKLTRYRFGHKTADFLICPACGTYVATFMDSPRGPIGVANVVGLNIPELKDEPVDFNTLDGESVEGRLERRLSRWTPLTLNEAAA